MKLHIHCRTDVPWSTMTIESFTAQASTINLPRDSRKRVSSGDILVLWEQAYGLSYFGYRETLKRVCRSMHLNWCERARAGYSAGAPLFYDADIIICVDDDDRIYPEAMRALSYFEDNPQVDIVTWNQVTVEHGREKPPEKARCYLDTCNFAMRRSFLESFSLEEQKVILSQHQYANRIIQVRLGIAETIPGVISPDYFTRNAPKTLVGHPSVIDVQQTWSLYYLHSGSISWLGSKMGNPSDVIAKLRQYPLHPLFDADVYDAVMKVRDKCLAS